MVTPICNPALLQRDGVQKRVTLEVSSKLALGTQLSRQTRETLPQKRWSARSDPQGCLPTSACVVVHKYPHPCTHVWYTCAGTQLDKVISILSDDSIPSKTM